MVNAKESSAQSIYTSDEIRESSGIEREMLAVVHQIRKLVNEDGFKYNDIAILGRTNDACAVAHDQLLSYGIPVTAAGEREFLDSPELRLLEALINLLDNMQQDIPLAAIMRSGLIRPAFSETELMIIRNADQDSRLPEIADRHFYASVLRYRD
jgi:ATP-dependent helicase/nuclease subunit A